MAQRPHRSLPAALVFLAVSCVGAHARIYYDRSTNFSNIRTYSWLRINAGGSLWADRIQNDVDVQLAALGWRKVSTGGDAGVTAFRSTSDLPTLDTFYDGFDGWNWSGSGHGIPAARAVKTPPGTLVVDIFDNGTKKPIWRGVARRRLSGEPGENRADLAKTISDLFKNFPPHSAAKISPTRVTEP